MNNLIVAVVDPSVQKAAGNLLDDLVKNDRIFTIMTLTFIAMFLIIAWISFKRHLKMLDNMETRLLDKQEENLELVKLMKELGTNLSEAQEINKKMVEITNQQQQYIESQKADRRLMESMNNKLDKLHLEIVKK
ncbi:hypothetical protein HT50_02325 [Listeria monocytogenes]|uniref:hypothetical protein n=1 Tax=Listeria TaxID=1637 RepID=UPI0004D959E4|nr:MULTISPECIES: hypothetical protein [Listeria]KEX80895.1 hypothetical protein HT50_02325 [Listeria monocytogenes]MBC1816981.1 hypothetical protein [Listeria seeligeri]MBC1934567.1 hypothetical protein [Listeria seeligeri]